MPDNQQQQPPAPAPFCAHCKKRVLFVEDSEHDARITEMDAENAQLQADKTYWQKVWEHRTADLKELEAENARLKEVVKTHECVHGFNRAEYDSLYKSATDLAARFQRVEKMGYALTNQVRNILPSLSMNRLPYRETLYQVEACVEALEIALAPAPDTGQSGSEEASGAA